MDDIDRAQEADARFREQSLSLQARVAAFAGVSRETCIDCGYEIPEGRRKFLPGCIRCVECQEAMEGDGNR